MFYVYKWYNEDTNEIFYVGKGCKNRYKDKKHRNRLFLKYVEEHPNVKSEIVKTFDTEEDAFAFEHELIVSLKKQDMCTCNLDNGGVGGCHFVWTQEMKEYKSEYNPMKDSKQKERMSKENPMKDPDVAKRVGEKHIKIIIYDGNEYTCEQLSKKFHVTKSAVLNWIERGYGPDIKDCYYKDFGPKPFIVASPYRHGMKPVYIDDKYFDSAKKASLFLGKKDSSSLLRHLKTDQKYLGHSCRYANQQPSLDNVK